MPARSGPTVERSGDVRTWTALAPVTSHGPSGIGFVNFGAIDRLDVRAPIATTGPGAGGFNLYDGKIETLGADVVSVEIDGKVDELRVAGGIAARGARYGARPIALRSCSMVRGFAT